MNLKIKSYGSIIAKLLLITTLLQIFLFTLAKVTVNRYTFSVLFIIVLFLFFYIIKWKLFDISIIHQNKVVLIKGQYLFLLILFLVYAAYLLLAKEHFNTDTYAIINNPYALKQSSLDSGRVLPRYMYAAFIKLNINVGIWQAFFMNLFIALTAFLATQMVKVLSLFISKPSTVQLLVILLASLLSFCNVFVLEWYLYPEFALTFAGSLFALIFAVSGFSWKPSILRDLIILVFMSFSVNFYQVTIGSFLILSFAVIMLKNNGNFSIVTIKEIIRVFIFGGLASVSNIALIRVFPSDRGPSLNLDLIFANFQHVLEQQTEILYDVYGLIPHPIFPIVIGCSLVILILSFVMYRGKKYNLILQVLLLLISYICIFTPHYISDTQWVTHRTIVPFFSFITLWYILALSNISFNPEEKQLEFRNFLTKAMVFVLGIFLWVNIFQMNDISMNHMAMNRIDKQYCLAIYEKIQEYEEQTGITIEYISIREDLYPSYDYSGVEYTKYDLNVRSLSKSWSYVSSINFYTDRLYKQEDMPDNIYNLYFKDKNWNSFRFEEQAVFVDNILYLMIY